MRERSGENLSSGKLNMYYNVPVTLTVVQESKLEDLKKKVRQETEARYGMLHDVMFKYDLIVLIDYITLQVKFVMHSRIRLEEEYLKLERELAQTKGQLNFQ